MEQNYGLGRGLASLIPQNKKNKTSQSQKEVNYFGKTPGNDNAGATEVDKKNQIQEINVVDIITNPYQPRSEFDESKLYELAESIKQHGVIQPIIVSQKNGQYEIIAGERRFQAAKIAGLPKIPAIIRTANSQQKLELAVVENIQRQDLNPVEEAKSYLKMADEFNLSQEKIAKKLGKSRSVVANKIRLLNLPVEIQKALIEGKITEGHAKLLLAIPNPEKQRAFFDMIIKNKLTVRQTEDKTKEISVRTHKRKIHIDPQIKNIEDEFSQALGTKVKIKKSGGGGKVVIEYYSQEELDNILKKLR